jgi:hypothetical protein
MTTEQNISLEEASAIEYVRDLKGFYGHLFSYFIVMSGLFIFNFLTTPEHFWVIWPAFGWGIGLISHALAVFEIFNFFGPDWEKKQIEKRLGKKL